MKYLMDYIEAKQEKLMQECGAFFAFNADQMKEKLVEGKKYVGLGAGTFVESDKAKQFVDGWAKIIEQGIEEDKQEHKAIDIIMRELENHEAFYTNNTDDTVEKLKGYGDGFNKEDIDKIFNDEMRKRFRTGEVAQ
jgi:hypothetical protein